MSSFEVHLSEDADKFLEKLDVYIRERIETRLRKLGDNQVPADAKFVKRDERGDKVFRYRIGEFRALYIVEDTQQILSLKEQQSRTR